jgi:hypothetical protein
MGLKKIFKTDKGNEYEYHKIGLIQKNYCENAVICQLDGYINQNLRNDGNRPEKTKPFVFKMGDFPNDVDCRDSAYALIKAHPEFLDAVDVLEE